MQPVDIAILVVYLGAIAGLAIWFSRRQKSTEDYFLVGRNLPGWVVSFSIMGTICSSATFVGHPGNVFHEDMYLVPSYVLSLVLMLFVARSIVVFYRHNVRMTAYDYLENRFGCAANKQRYRYCLTLNVEQKRCVITF